MLATNPVGSLKKSRPSERQELRKPDVNALHWLTAVMSKLQDVGDEQQRGARCSRERRQSPGQAIVALRLDSGRQQRVPDRHSGEQVARDRVGNADDDNAVREGHGGCISKRRVPTVPPGAYCESDQQGRGTEDSGTPNAACSDSRYSITLLVTMRHVKSGCVNTSSHTNYPYPR